MDNIRMYGTIVKKNIEYYCSCNLNIRTSRNKDQNGEVSLSTACRRVAGVEAWF
jgi:hypothetical protein